MVNIIQNKNTAGFLLFTAGFILLMGIITAEISYPAVYTTANNDISDLGATLPPNSIIYPIPSTIFNYTMLISGILIFLSTLLMYRSNIRIKTIVPIMLLGLAILGIGIFPGNIMPIHGLFSMAAFILGGLSAIFSSKSVSAPYRYIVILLGLITLTFLLLAIFNKEQIFALLGNGGTERWVAYPVIIWIISYGGYLMGNEK